MARQPQVVAAVRAFDVRPYSKWFGESRQEALAELHALLAQPAQADQLKLVIVRGAHGIGKTQLVRRFAYLHRDYYNNRCWVIEKGLHQTELRDVKDFIKRIFDVTARELASGEENPSLQLHALYDHLSKQGKSLIVFDNIQNREEIDNFLPKAIANKANLDIVITTTRGIYPNEKKVSLKIDDEALNNDTRNFLANFFMHKNIAYTDDQINALMQEFDSLPLAVNQAACYLASKMETRAGYGIERFLTDYRQHKANLLNQPSEDYPASMMTIINMTLDSIKAKDSYAHDIIYTCAYLAYNDIPIQSLDDFFKNRYQFDNTQQALELLYDYSLIEFTNAKTAFTVNPMVQQIMRVNLQENYSFLRQAIKFIIASIKPFYDAPLERSTQFVELNFRYKRNDNQQLRKINTLLDHAVQIIKFSQELDYTSKALIKLIYSVGVYYLDYDYYLKRAQEFFTLAKDLYEQGNFGLFWLEYKIQRQSFKMALRSACKPNKNNYKADYFDKAETFLKNATQLLNDNCDHFDLLQQIENKLDWAGFYLTKIEYFNNQQLNLSQEEDNANVSKIRADEKTHSQVRREVKQYLEEALKLLEDYTEQNKLNMLAMLHHYFGNYYFHNALKDYDKALEHYQQALNYKLSLDDNREIGRTQHSIGLTYLKKYEKQDLPELLVKAEEHLKQAFNYKMAFHITLNNKEIGDTLQVLAELYEIKKQPRIALKLSLYVGLILKNIGREDFSKNDKRIIRLYKTIGRYQEAKEYVYRLPVERQAYFSDLLSNIQTHITEHFKPKPIQIADLTIANINKLLCLTEQDVESQGQLSSNPSSQQVTNTGSEDSQPPAKKRRFDPALFPKPANDNNLHLSSHLKDNNHYVPILSETLVDENQLSRINKL